MALYGYAVHGGVGCRKDAQRGAQVLQKSRHVIARVHCLLCGIGTQVDYIEAFRLLSTECDASDPHVQYLLGVCYCRGFGCARDEALAEQCFERAAQEFLVAFD
eukprot:TRINITY_DN9500_c0_g2_i1.p2 TRINITY_DN9500_c0_g2~~TRINITY_DN9500_c0_g2_i1.p2  ORF type:complete len:118 (-),score=22.44 TRINITY_DN9500_c0_g2_i1:33-344(-)